MLFASLALALAAVPATPTAQGDWLVDPSPFVARLHEQADGKELVLENGLARRVWRLQPNAACLALDDLTRDASLLRATRPLARIVLDGTSYDIGGLSGQADQAFLLPEEIENLQADADAFRFVGYRSGPIEARLAWKRIRHAAPDAAWPPPGVHLMLDFAPPQEAPAAHAAIAITVHLELYDGLPLYAKWVEVRNTGESIVEVDRLTSEILAVVEEANWVETRDGVALPRPSSLHVETDYAFGGFTAENATRQSVHWLPDPSFTSQVNWSLATPCLLEIAPERGPDVLLAPDATLSSFRAFELLQDSSDRERRGLARRRMMRTLAPWVTENPLILHVVSTDPQVVRAAIDQAAECGFEMLSLSFGSGLNMEDESEANLSKFRDLSAYAAGKGIELGGYSLLSSRRIQPDSDNIVNPETGKPGGQTHGYCPALSSAWGQNYFRKLTHFFEATGFLQFTHDGSYPGDFDAATRPPLQRGLDDSQWVQHGIISEFYAFLRARGVYLRVPDYYYLNGANECGMGYREVNWSLPRALQVLHTRQNIFDGTWTKAPSMGWMFVPLTQYHGGGAAATIEPLDQHLEHYRRMIQSNLALGVQAVYRGTRLYDTPRVREMVRGEVAWYKQYRDILESDLIHGRRADGRDLDWMLHVNPTLDVPGMLVVFNPLAQEVTRTLRIPLHYTGIRGSVKVAERGQAPTAAQALPPGEESAAITVTVPAKGMNWFTLQRGD